MQSQLKVKGMTLVFKQPINLGKDAQSDVKTRWAYLACVCVHVHDHTKQFLANSFILTCEMGMLKIGSEMQL